MITFKFGLTLVSVRFIEAKNLDWHLDDMPNFEL